VVEGLDYERMGRGTDCTSADAAGYPVAALTFDADELAAGEINHALRFVLPNANIRRLSYVAPATHSTGATNGPDDAPPYGAHMRLKTTAELQAAHPDVRFDALPRGARVIITTLQKYGMFLSDGGNIALTGESDQHTEAKYYDRENYAYGDEDPNRLLHEHDLKFLRISDFEMLDNGGPERSWGQAGCTLLYNYDDSVPQVTER
jgi:serine/threonine-protein kinase